MQWFGRTRQTNRGRTWSGILRVTRERVGLLTCLALWSGLGCLAHGDDYAQEVHRDHPVAFWRFNDAASTDGAVAKDELGRHAGVYRGGVTLEPGVAGTGGRAARFNGTTAHVIVPDHPDFALNTLSVEFWFKTTQPWDQSYWPASATLVSKATAGGASSDWTIVGGSAASGRNQGRIVAATGPAGGSGDQLLLSPLSLNDARWHHAVWTRSAEGVSHLYVDGRLRDVGNDGGGSIVNARAISIGGDPLLARGTFFDGSMAEVAIYSRALLPERVRAHYVALNPAALVSQGDQAGAPVTKPLETMVLRNQTGLRWQLERRGPGWAWGTIFLHDQPVDAGLTSGMLRLRHTRTEEERWLPASTGRRLDDRTARFSGQAQVEGARFAFEMDMALTGQSALAITTRWSVDKDLAGWEVCLAYHDVSATNWHGTVYPFAGDAEQVKLERVTYVGVPAVLLFRPDLSVAALFGIDPASDYLNPTTWTGATGFHFKNQIVAPQFRAGGGELKAGTQYALPLQVFLSDAGDAAKAITALVRDWIEVNRYRVAPLRVRSANEAFDLFVAGRRRSRMWQPGQGYQIMDGWKVIYTAESPINAWFDYLLYEQTGDREWRQRAFDTMAFMLKAQHTDPADPHYGVIETNYELDNKVFNSADHSPNFGYKLDMNAYAARYMLMLWERVKQREGLDQQPWYQAAARIADWVVRQQNPDGGLPQVVDYRTHKKSMSVISGRALAGMPVIHRITGDQKYGKLVEAMEQFLRQKVEGRFWFTGAHVDLWPKDFEADSVWHAVEYWLGKYDRTGDREALARAEANAWFAFLMWCPKQLSWVANPTQTCHTEQENYRQYSNYCYNNRKYYCLDRLAKLTREPLFGQLCERVMQCGFWSQATTGDWLGGQYERLSDPWQAVSKEVNSKGQVYVSELALDAHLQLLEMGLVKPKLQR